MPEWAQILTAILVLVGALGSFVTLLTGLVGWIMPMKTDMAGLRATVTQRLKSHSDAIADLRKRQTDSDVQVNQLRSDSDVGVVQRKSMSAVIQEIDNRLTDLVDKHNQRTGGGVCPVGIEECRERVRDDERAADGGEP